MTARKSTSGTWFDRAMFGLQMAAGATSKVKLGVRNTLHAAEVVSVALEVGAQKGSEFIHDMRKANEVLRTALSAAHMEAAEQFGDLVEAGPVMSEQDIKDAVERDTAEGDEL